MEQQAKAEAWFTVQTEGAAPAHRQPLSEVLAANADDEDLVAWLQRAKVGASYTVGGGAAPAIAVRRVA